ncbi:MAG TPA: TIGR04255 family protein [Woeseiaceae bacterium]|nr:TIGR04255 family protein [Woeseiaceae bacterium]
MANNEIKFKKPPLNEIVFQVIFPELVGFGGAHIGLFWSEFRDRFPTIQSAPRVELAKSFNLANGVLPENRIWLIHKDNSQVIQIQDDRFMFNWRDVGEETTYPGFDALYPIFKEYFSAFIDFLESEEKAPKFVTGFELNYVNHIYPDVWEDWSDIGEIFPAFNWRSNPSPMPDIKGFRYFMQSTLDDDIGELTVTIDSRTHKKTSSPLVNFEIKVTGGKRELEVESLDAVFLPAHDGLVDTLVSMVSEKVRASWNSDGST